MKVHPKDQTSPKMVGLEYSILPWASTYSGGIHDMDCEGVELFTGKVTLSNDFADPKSAIAASTRNSPCFTSMFAFEGIAYSLININRKM